MPKQRRSINRRNAVLDGANVPAEPTDYSAMSTEALPSCLENVTSSKPVTAANLSRDYNRMSSHWRSTRGIGCLNRLHGGRADKPPTNPRWRSQLCQHCPTRSAQSPGNLQDSLRSSPPPPPQDGGQNTTRQQQPSLHNPPPGNLLPNTAVSSGLAASSGLGSLSSPVDFSDPAQVASLHPNFRQPSLASHLTKATSTAITNREYVDFATLLPMTSLLTDTIHSHLNLKVGDQGLTIPLPSSSKRPKITSIDRWLDAFAIYFAVIVSVYPSRAADLIAYQQLIRDAARKFPGMAWYVYDVEFRRRASHNLSAKWGERDVQLYLDTFTGLPKSGCRSCGSTDHLSDTCPLSPRRSRDALTQSDLCYNFNKGRPCARTPCPYQHRCNQPGCSAAHSGEDHTKLTRHREDRPKSSSSSGNSSRGHS